jgi:TonB family protein
MTAHVDILEGRESLRRPLYVSTILHVCLLAALALQGFLPRRSPETWGHPDSLGGSAVGITPVSQIPLPSRGGVPNPLASDTESSVPEPPAAKIETRKAPEPDPSAVAIKGRTPKRPAKATQSRRSSLTAETGPEQVYSSTGRGLSSPLVGRTGSGGVGIGTGGAFGNRFGFYRDLLEQKVAQKWRTDEVDPRLQTAPPAIVTFLIYRNGSTADVRLEQSSGNRALDYSALRAIYEASPFPPLPAGYERNDARIEFWFQLRR